jgi:hypothetical protein
MLFSGIRAFLLKPLKVDGMNHMLSELVLQIHVHGIVTCCIAPYHMHHDISINSPVHFNLERECMYPISPSMYPS